MIKAISTTEAARNLGDYVAKVRHTGQTFILHKNEKPVAALGPLPKTRTITFRQLMGAVAEITRRSGFC